MVTQTFQHRFRAEQGKVHEMPEIEYVTLANHAEAINGLLYLQGAGWTDLRVVPSPVGQPTIAHIGIGISILVGWNETNTSFPLTFTMLSEDGGTPMLQGEGQIEAGRPPGSVQGSDMRNVLALNADLIFPQPGGYELRVSLDDKVKSVAFRVHLSA
jgi:hypothetical protein